MSYSELEHFSNMVSGCESLTRGNPKEPNAVYALAVLKLHAGDAGHISGTESFLDNVKRGAQSLKKWFLELLKAIGSFIDRLSGVDKRIKEREKEIERKLKEAKADLELTSSINEKLVGIFNSAFTEPQRLAEQVYDAITATSYLDSSTFESFNVTNMRIHSGYEAIKQLIYSSKNDAPETREVHKELNHLQKAIDTLSAGAKREVSTWADEDEQAAHKRDIAATSYLLKNYSKVLGWYTAALDSYTKKALEVKA